MSVRTTFTIRLTEAEAHQLAALAAERKVSVNAQLRQYVRDGIHWRGAIKPTLDRIEAQIESVQTRLGIPCSNLFKQAGF
jgi:hypothetical protein